MKCKCDYWRENVAVIDLKTTDDASEKGFMKSVMTYGYHQQAAHYMDVMQAAGSPVGRFIFVVVEKTAPYLVAIHELSIALGFQTDDEIRDISPPPRPASRSVDDLLNPQPAPIEGEFYAEMA